MLKVLGRFSSINVRKVLWTCVELGLAHEREEWGSPQLPLRDPEFLRLNPQGLVPVIVEGDFVLSESNTICRYLASSQGAQALLPQAPRERAVVEQWMDWQATELNTAWRYAFMSRVRQHPDFQDEAAALHSVTQWNRHMGLLEQRLAHTGAYAAGAAFTLADVGLGLSVHRWLMTPMPRPDLPAVAAYVERLAKRPAWASVATSPTP